MLSKFEVEMQMSLNVKIMVYHKQISMLRLGCRMHYS